MHCICNAYLFKDGAHAFNEEQNRHPLPGKRFRRKSRFGLRLAAKRRFEAASRICKIDLSPFKAKGKANQVVVYLKKQGRGREGVMKSIYY